MYRQNNSPQRDTEISYQSDTEQETTPSEKTRFQSAVNDSLHWLIHLINGFSLIRRHIKFENVHGEAKYFVDKG